jgi:hypothetical protein
MDLQSFSHFVAAGFDTMRADNYLSDGSFASTKLAVRSYLDDVHVQNVVTELFPHSIEPNGDVLVKLVGNPGPMKRQELPPIEIKMLDHEMNGVRDSAVHWLVLQTVFKEKAFAMDPFAAEYLSEVLSMMMTLWIRRSEMIAKELGKTAIDAEVAKRARDRNYVMVPPRAPPSPAWTEERQANKSNVFGMKGPDGSVRPMRKALYNDVTARSGLPKTLDLAAAANDKGQHAGTFNIQTIMGGGVAVGDINGDGYPDLFLNGEGLGRLYINRGKAAPLSFEDKTEAYGIPGPINDGHGALIYDLEGDGDLDLVVVRSEHPSLVMEQRDGKLFDVSNKVGIKTGKGAHVATAFDYDRDGDLDLYIGYYGNAKVNAGLVDERSLPSLDGRNGTPNQLWQRQDDNTYREVGAKAGVADIGWTLAAAAFDHDMDGDLDLYLANDFGPNAMFENKGDGSFTDITAKTHTGDRGSGMNVDMSDVNGDGRWDLYVTNIDMFSKRIKVVFPRDESTVDIDQSLVQAFQYLNGNKLYVSQLGDDDRPYISSENMWFEPGDRGWGWDASFFDWDNDGDDDLYVTNGWIEGSYAGSQKNQMFIADKAFYYQGPPTSSETFAGNSRSAAVADFDRDGDVDIVVNNFRAPPVVLENPFSGYNKWIELELVGAAPNSRAVGALVTIKAGDWKTLRQVMTGRGYLSQADTTMHTGIGAPVNQVDVEIRWPDGTVTEAKGLRTNRLHKIEKPGS